MNSPVGLFDSGVGGLTVLRSFLERNPEMSFVYYGDTAHCPYGDRPLDEVRDLAGAAVEYLVDRNCDPIVFACNISSSVALEPARAEHPELTMHGLLSEALAGTVELRSESGIVGVLATTGTVESNRYRELLESRGLTVHQQACPQLVPLVESGRTEGTLVHQTLEPLLDPLLESGVDTLVLGCTHYPYLTGEIRRLVPDSVSLVDPGRVLAESVTVTANGSDNRIRSVVATGDRDSLRQFLRRDENFSDEWLEFSTEIEPGLEGEFS